MDLQSVGLAVILGDILGDEGKFALRRDPENLAESNVRDGEVAGAVEGRAFKKAVAGAAALAARMVARAAAGTRAKISLSITGWAAYTGGRPFRVSGHRA